jgi:hypothetical protein
MQGKMRSVPELLLPGNGAILASASQDSDSVRTLYDFNLQHGFVETAALASAVWPTSA